ncbi:MAG: CPBP family intramembrane metalloprotease [Acidobacteria bacterium]|nr:CPBP family intramembrane metalloprotease [Acidobacteriota bacterium]
MPDNDTPSGDSAGFRSDSSDPVRLEPGLPAPCTALSRGKRKVGAAVAWLLILATIAIVQTPQSSDRETPPHGFADDMTLRLTARYAVGMKSVLGNDRALEYFKPQLVELLRQADNPRNSLSIVPILAELGTREDALRELNRLREDPPNDHVARDVPLFLQLYREGAASLSPRQRLQIENYGWIGALALSREMAPSDPERMEIVRSGLKTFVAVIAFTILLAAALAAGLALLVAAVALRAGKRLQTRFTVVPDPGEPLLEAFAIYIFGFLALPVLARWILPGYPALPSLFLIPAVAVAVLWPLARRSGWGDTLKALGWVRGQGFFREAGSGIVGYIAGLPLVALSVVLVLAITRHTGTVPAHPIVNEIRDDPAVLILLFGIASIWAPVVEETFFRGALYGYLRRRWSWPAASALTGVLFAVIHPQGWVGVPALATIGFILGAIREWRGSLIAPMTAHALNNGTVLLLAIFLLT